MFPMHKAVRFWREIFCGVINYNFWQLFAAEVTSDSERSVILSLSNEGEGVNKALFKITCRSFRNCRGTMEDLDRNKTIFPVMFLFDRIFFHLMIES